MTISIHEAAHVQFVLVYIYICVFGFYNNYSFFYIHTHSFTYKKKNKKKKKREIATRTRKYTPIVTDQQPLPGSVPWKIQFISIGNTEYERVESISRSTVCLKSGSNAP